MHLPSVGYSDLTELECMQQSSIGSKDTESDSKAEVILANLQQRFKKDQIYVSVWDFSTWVGPWFPKGIARLNGFGGQLYLATACCICKYLTFISKKKGNFHKSYRASKWVEYKKWERWKMCWNLSSLKKIVLCSKDEHSQQKSLFNLVSHS